MSFISFNLIFMNKYKFLYIILCLSILFGLNSCGLYKKTDVKDTPVSVDERVKKNIQEGRGIRFGKGATRGGDFDFASSNPLWRASIEIFDFVPLTNASYSGGILITDWFSSDMLYFFISSRSVSRIVTSVCSPSFSLLDLFPELLSF